MQYSIVQCSVVQGSERSVGQSCVVWFGVVQCSVMQGSIVQCSVVYCMLTQFGAVQCQLWQLTVENCPIIIECKYRFYYDFQLIIYSNIFGLIYSEFRCLIPVATYSLPTIDFHCFSSPYSSDSMPNSPPHLPGHLQMDQFLNHDFERVLNRDSFADSRPIVSDVSTYTEIRTLFDMITYSKVGVILRSQVNNCIIRRRGFVLLCN